MSNITGMWQGATFKSWAMFVKPVVLLWGYIDINQRQSHQRKTIAFSVSWKKQVFPSIQYQDGAPRANWTSPDHRHLCRMLVSCDICRWVQNWPLHTCHPVSWMQLAFNQLGHGDYSSGDLHETSAGGSSSGACTQTHSSSGGDQWSVWVIRLGLYSLSVKTSYC